MPLGTVIGRGPVAVEDSLRKSDRYVLLQTNLMVPCRLTVGATSVPFPLPPDPKKENST